MGFFGRLRIDFRQQDIFSLEEIDDRFDLVLCCLVLNHVQDIKRALQMLCQRVRLNGFLVVTDFHPFNLLTGMRTSFDTGEQKYHVPNFEHLPSTYIELAMKEGTALHEFHESGTVPGYPGVPATIGLVFRK